MSDFSKYIEKGKETVKKGYNKAKDVISEKKGILNLKMELRNKNAELRKLYEEYGKLCYEGVEEGSCEEYVEKITAKLDSILELEVAIKELTAVKDNKLYCSKCGKESKLDDEYCSKCGEKLK